MAKTANNKKEVTMEEALWKSADKLRGSVEPAEYKHVVLSLFFLKFASDKFDKRRQEIISEGHGAYVDIPEFYAMKNVFFLPEESRWSFIMEHAKQDNIALIIDTALYTVEKNSLVGTALTVYKNSVLVRFTDQNKKVIFKTKIEY